MGITPHCDRPPPGPVAPTAIVWLDEQITRRKRFHIATDLNGTVLTRDYTLSAVLEALRALEHERVWLHDLSDRRIQLDLNQP